MLTFVHAIYNINYYYTAATVVIKSSSFDEEEVHVLLTQNSTKLIIEIMASKNTISRVNRATN